MDPFGPEASSQKRRRPCVLIAEDDDDIRTLLATTLRGDGYYVIEAHDGQEVLERIAPMLFDEAEGPDAIITDVRMPGVSGMTLLAGLRAIGWKTPIIVITAHDIDASRSEARYLGADVVFGKPFDVDELRATLTRLLLRPDPPSA